VSIVLWPGVWAVVAFLQLEPRLRKEQYLATNVRDSQ